MDKKDKLTNAHKSDNDINLDKMLRPQTLADYTGQETIKRNLDIVLKAATSRKEPIEHVLLYGPAGLGKTSLANIIARETKADIIATSGPGIEKASDLVSILTNLKNGDILFIDEIHRLPKSVEESLYLAMEDFILDIVIGKGAQAKTIRLDLPRFTLIGATTKISMLSAAFRGRFGLTYHLEYYSAKEISDIIDRASKIFNCILDDNARITLANSSRSTPRISNRLLKRVRDYAQVNKIKIINQNCVEATLALLEIDAKGLEKIDREMLKSIIENFNGGPVGLKTLAALTGEEDLTIEEVYEPYLMSIGFMQRTNRGRMVTEKAYKHLGIHHQS
jgi:holliday junction DNA helicase RuvB